MPARSFIDEAVDRQRNSKSGVVGKILVRQGNSNRFALVIRCKGNVLKGIIYRVQPDADGSGNLCRNVTYEGDPIGEDFEGAPFYSNLYLNLSRFWFETF